MKIRNSLTLTLSALALAQRHVKSDLCQMSLSCVFVSLESGLLHFGTPLPASEEALRSICNCSATPADRSKRRQFRRQPLLISRSCEIWTPEVTLRESPAFGSKLLSFPTHASRRKPVGRLETNTGARAVTQFLRARASPDPTFFNCQDATGGHQGKASFFLTLREDLLGNRRAVRGPPEV